MGRIACYAIEAGESQTEIIRELKRCLKTDEEECDCARLQQLIRLLEPALALAIAIIAGLTPVGKIIRGIRYLIAGSRLELPDKVRTLTVEEYEAIIDAQLQAGRSQEQLQRVLNELSLAEREAFGSQAPRINIIER